MNPNQVLLLLHSKEARVFLKFSALLQYFLRPGPKIKPRNYYLLDNSDIVQSAHQYQ